MSQYFANYTDTTLSLIGFGMFALVFVGSLIWTSIKSNRRMYDEIASKILNDGESHGRK